MNILEYLPHLFLVSSSTLDNGAKRWFTKGENEIPGPWIALVHLGWCLPVINALFYSRAIIPFKS
jgi:hypothetical protein